MLFTQYKVSLSVDIITPRYLGVECETTSRTLNTIDVSSFEIISARADAVSAYLYNSGLLFNEDNDAIAVFGIR